MSPRRHQHPDKYADEAAEAIRSLNHLTIHRDSPGYEWPSDVDAVIAHLSSTVAGMDQALGQAFNWLVREHQAGKVGHDAGLDVAPELRNLRENLTGVSSQINELTVNLDKLRRVTSHLTGRITGGAEQ
ncbi:hypothetical protein GCM10022223_47140 [Kineosporia mesophila]|uniref:Uncharacterized protein n=1 Tax=Kineosporia mesophila TaxID=566012 RepID=A0ABP7A463_9ACTN|nr:hypothetical protein [Kineosporia mesophila]MCD5353822.1 hypothetical protein [Kineosporia mesophila]